MEYQKITNLLGTTLDEIPWFITEKWVEVHDQSGSADDRYKQNKQIRFKTSMLRSDLCDYSDAHIVVKGDITLKKTITRGFTDTRNRFLAFKNNAPLHMKDKECINWQCRRSRYCNVNVQFASIQ